jgi:hypothetical protein
METNITWTWTWEMDTITITWNWGTFFAKYLIGAILLVKIASDMSQRNFEQHNILVMPPIMKRMTYRFS